MKIQCAVCQKGEAAVYCTADEAALCTACDHGVHYANKLASKHHRFSLLHSPPKQAPLCDICQERRAFLFCQQDRAILCRECDIPIHKANPHTEKHNRFLLTGVKLSPNAVVYSPAAEANVSDAVPCFSSKKGPVSVNPGDAKIPPSSACFNSSGTLEHEKIEKNTSNNVTSDAKGSPTSSISEYLIEMLPGWHVEELLDSSSPFGFCKSTNNSDVMPFWEGGLDNKNLTFTSSETAALWVPEAPPPQVAAAQVNPVQYPWFPANSNICFGGQDQTGVKEGRKWNDDNVFAVPQISPPANVSKRFRTLW